MEVRNITRVWVKPSPEVTAPNEFPLSDLDIVQVPYHIPVLFIYRSGGVLQGEKLPPETGLLTRSLAHTLGAFYTLAGRIQEANGRLCLTDFNQGVPFVESYTESDLPSDAHLQPSQFTPALLATPTPGISGTPLGAPVLTVKVTRFRCGGLVLGVSFHHQAADASAFFSFMRAWAAGARGILSPSPHLDRTVLIDRWVRKGLKNDRPKASSAEAATWLDTWRQHSSFWRAYADLRWRSLGRKQSLLRITFSKEEVAWLKRQANEQSSGGWEESQVAAGTDNAWASSDDALSAHMWRSITRARALSASTTVTFDRHVDMRARLDPPLPANYVGSSNSGPPRLSTSAGQLAERKLGHVAQRLRRDVLQMGESYLDAVLSRFRSAAFVPHFVARASPFGTAVRVTSWAKFPVYDADFGGCRPALVTLSELPPFFDGVVEIQETPEGNGGLDAIVFLQEEHLDRLRNDPELHLPVIMERSP